MELFSALRSWRDSVATFAIATRTAVRAASSAGKRASRSASCSLMRAFGFTYMRSFTFLPIGLPGISVVKESLSLFILCARLCTSSHRRQLSELFHASDDSSTKPSIKKSQVRTALKPGRSRKTESTCLDLNNKRRALQDATSRRFDGTTYSPKRQSCLLWRPKLQYYKSKKRDSYLAV